MVRCDIPCCYDEYCMSPRPGDKGYEGARKAREDRVRAYNSRAKIKSPEEEKSDWWQERMRKDNNYMREQSTQEWWRKRMENDK